MLIRRNYFHFPLSSGCSRRLRLQNDSHILRWNWWDNPNYILWKPFNDGHKIYLSALLLLGDLSIYSWEIVKYIHVFWVSTCCMLEWLVLARWFKDFDGDLLHTSFHYFISDSGSRLPSYKHFICMHDILDLMWERCVYNLSGSIRSSFGSQTAFFFYCDSYKSKSK